MSTRTGDRSHLLAGTDPRRAFVLLLGASAVVVALHVVTGLALQLTDAGWAESLYRVFNVNDEGNVPTFFAALLWLAAATVTWRLAQASRPDARARRSWLAIGVLCVLIALDEGLALHERLIEPVREATGADGILHYAWVIPYAVIALVVALVLAPFVWRLGRPVNVLIVLAGAIFVVGALGMELGEGYIASDLDEDVTTTSTFVALYTVEETLELLGISLFIYALLRQLRSVLGAQATSAPADRS